jgi:hypothetical protein
MGSLQRSHLQKFVSKANLQPKFKAQQKMSNNFLTAHPRRKTSPKTLDRNASPHYDRLRAACSPQIRPSQAPAFTVVGERDLGKCICEQLSEMVKLNCRSQQISMMPLSL